MNKEFEFLKIIKNITKSDYIGDDCAYLDEYKLSISQDSLIEDVHFSLKYMDAYEIAQKALLVNISDILASGALAKYALISLGGNLDDEFVKKFYKGINEVSKLYDLKIIGGDLVASSKIIITITILGSYENRVSSSRKNAKEGYIVAVAGEFGSSAKGFLQLKQGEKDTEFIKIHKYPVLHPEISSFIARNVSNYAMMDSSDGLFDCLYQISQKSKVKIEIQYDKIPCSIEDRELVLYGGEDYSLVVCLPEDDFKKINGLIEIGNVKKGSGVFVDNQKLEYKSYEHFKKN